MYCGWGLCIGNVGCFDYCERVGDDFSGWVVFGEGCDWRGCEC